MGCTTANLQAAQGWQNKQGRLERVQRQAFRWAQGKLGSGAEAHRHRATEYMVVPLHT